MNKVLMSILLLGAIAVVPVSAMHVPDAGAYNPKVTFAKTMAKQVAAYGGIAALSGVAYYDGTSDFWARCGMILGAAGMSSIVALYCYISYEDIRNLVITRVEKRRYRFSDL